MPGKAWIISHQGDLYLWYQGSCDMSNGKKLKAELGLQMLNAEAELG